MTLAGWQSVAFIPMLPPLLLALLALCCALPLVWAALIRARGTLLRALACVIALVALAGPRVVTRIGSPLPDIALEVIDRSASMQVGHRAALAGAAAQVLEAGARADPALHLRRVDVTDAQDGTRLFAAVDAALADIPPSQRAGVIALTDGMVADAPGRFDLPLHVLIPATGEQTDRRLRVTQAPGYGIVGEAATIGFTVDDLGQTPHGGRIAVTWSLDGGAPATLSVTEGTPATITVPIAHAGPATVALAAAMLPGEAATANNRAALTVNGVRDRLRVLLISGQPHAGERTWRRLLKSDPAVDLVHFTILRTPGKDDLTPISQLALIAFPVHELFVDRIGQFDLIILDRFSDPGILPAAYLQNIADYVRNGGALLVSAGPELAGPGSIADGPIGDILPALPLDGDAAVATGAFRPVVTPIGKRHPVTADLAGDAPAGADAPDDAPDDAHDDVHDDAPHWGEWYRHIVTGAAHGQIVLTAGPGGAPLLLLDHVGDGRVALLLSDQIWLWSRGHQGGGPAAELLRRVAHWLMKEPDLDETALVARIDHGQLTITRRTLAASPDSTATVTDPDGVVQAQHFGPGQRLTLPAIRPGLWQVQAGTQSAYAAAPPADPAEFADLRATATLLRPLARSIHWLDPTGPPTLGSLKLRRNHAVQLSGLSSRPLLPAWLALALILACVIAGWRREGQ